MSEFEYLGEFPAELLVSPEHLSIEFSASMASNVHRWKNKNRSADFLADYFANFFPNAEEAPTQTATQAEMRSAIGFISNELLENTIKFNYDPDCKMNIQLHLNPHSVVFLSTNSINPDSAAHFRAYAEELLSGDPGEMYIQKIEQNVESDSDASGLGFLTMLNDYGTRLAWRFEYASQSNGEPLCKLTTMVTLEF